LDIFVVHLSEFTDVDLASVQEKHGNIDVFKLICNLLFVGRNVRVLREIKSNSLSLDLREFGLELFAFGFDLRKGAANNANVEALRSHLVADLKANTV